MTDNALATLRDMARYSDDRLESECDAIQEAVEEIERLRAFMSCVAKWQAAQAGWKDPDWLTIQELIELYLGTSKPGVEDYLIRHFQEPNLKGGTT